MPGSKTQSRSADVQEGGGFVVDRIAINADDEIPNHLPQSIAAVFMVVTDYGWGWHMSGVLPVRGWCFLVYIVGRYTDALEQIQRKVARS